VASSFYRPQLARLVKHAPDGDDWLHEMKYDGYRIGCRIHGSSVTLVTRTGKNWTATFPEVVAAAGALGTRDAVLDGEIAVVLPDGRTSFQALQNAFGGVARSLRYFVFDLLSLDGLNLRRQPLERRKEALARLIGKPRPSAVIQFADHVVGHGSDLFEQACRLRLEGIISKRRTAPYVPGRGDTWVKTKCALRQEFVIGGFTDPEGSREGIGALLIGYYDESGALIFAGKVGTGFSVAVARDLRRRLEAIERRTAAFTPPPPPALGRRAHWVAPTLVGEVTFTEWTNDGRIRHPSFQGLRRDKPARTVTRDHPADAPAAMPKRFADLSRRTPARTPPARPARPSAVVSGIPISHPDRVVYPDLGVTKLELAQFYERIGEWMLPHVQGRPLTLVRCPDGVGSECFFMKHSKVWAPAALRRVKIQEKTKVGDYLVADTQAAIIGLVQMGVVEIHTWNTRIERVEQPDRVVFDVDPGARVPWSDVIASARLIRRLLDNAGLESFPKTTGGSGLHVVVPLTPAADWGTCLDFARTVAVALERRNPDKYTTAFAKAGRERKILIDYLRNNRTNTSVAAFSTRARAGGPVSVPLRWSELGPDLDPATFTVRTVERRLARLRDDPWAGYWTCRQRLPKSHTWLKESR
jgi:bifunctional non-homologous end joining protein LigD